MFRANLFRLQNYYNFSKYASIFEEKNDVLLTFYKIAPFLVEKRLILLSLDYTI